ncbi:MAG: NAD-dependent epimerase/dehydratase family protein [Gaiellaceae bacterium]
MSRFLVTGAFGCIGAWTVAELVGGGREVVTFDLAAEPRRLALLLDELEGFDHVVGDITDTNAVDRAFDGITHVIHLAALQVPFVRADPPLGARVNVLGTVNVFEAAKKRDIRVVYASSIAALDADGETVGVPTTLYGAFKRANEHTAAVYHAEHGVESIGLRPHTVYGVGRDQGMTSAPTVAMLAAAAGRSYTIPYGGSCQMQFARDVAAAFIDAADSDAAGATVHNLPGRRVSVDEIVDTIGSDRIGHDDTLLPFPEEVDATSFAEIVPGFSETPLAEGVGVTVERFRTLLANGEVTYE